MSREEVKTAISEILEHSSDKVLHEVLDYLKDLNPSPDHAMRRTENLRKILIQDKELLERLAK